MYVLNYGWRKCDIIAVLFVVNLLLPVLVGACIYSFVFCSFCVNYCTEFRNKEFSELLNVKIQLTA